jgi:enediyne biosynthesis protein E4
MFRKLIAEWNKPFAALLLLTAILVSLFLVNGPPKAADVPDEERLLGREPPVFRDVAEQAGVAFKHSRDYSFFNLGGGAAAGDFNRDGWLDIYVTNSRGPNALYRNNGDGTFTDIAQAAGVADGLGKGHGAAWGDYNNDGLLDLYVANWGTSKLFRNNGIATFTDVTIEAGVGDPGPDYRTTGVAWGDFDQDGFLDLIVVRHINSSAEQFMPTGIQASLLNRCRTEEFFRNPRLPRGVTMMEPNALENHPELRRDFSIAARPLTLYHNNGDGTFSDVTRFLGDGSVYPNNLMGAGFKPSFVDFNDDGRPDIYVVNDLGLEDYPNVLWRNDGPDSSGSWKFTDVSAMTRTNVAMYGMGLAVGDYKNEGHLDFYITDMGASRFLENQNGLFQDVTGETGTGRGVIPENGAVHDSIGWGATFADFDNDGWLDLYYVAGYLDSDPCMNLPNQPNAVFVNRGDGSFVDVSKASKANDPGIGREVIAADFNGDGLIDLYVVNIGSLDGNLGTARLFLNSSKPENHWLDVRVEGTRSNRAAVGAKVIVTAGGVARVQYVGLSQGHMSQSVTPVHFGLGKATQADSVEVRWPSGIVQNFTDVPVDHILTVIESP